MPAEKAAVLVVSGSAETLDGMHDYLSRIGVASLGFRTLSPLAQPSASVRAMVLFPDEFRAEEVAAHLSMVRAQRPNLAVVVVTGDPRAYESMTMADGRPLGAMVLPRPAFGWAILDALRAALS